MLVSSGALSRLTGPGLALMGDAGLALDGVMGPLEWSDIWPTIYSKHATLSPRSYTPTAPFKLKQTEKQPFPNM